MQRSYPPKKQTYPTWGKGTSFSQKAVGKMIFLFPRWDMLVPHKITFCFKWSFVLHGFLHASWFLFGNLTSEKNSFPGYRSLGRKTRLSPGRAPLEGCCLGEGDDWMIVELPGFLPSIYDLCEFYWFASKTFIWCISFKRIYTNFANGIDRYVYIYICINAYIYATPRTHFFRQILGLLVCLNLLPW